MTKTTVPPTNLIARSLTEVLQCSATNYLLGATPLKFPAFLVGSLAGLTVWCSIYAALGGAGRELLNVHTSPTFLIFIYKFAHSCHRGFQLSIMQMICPS